MQMCHSQTSVGFMGHDAAIHPPLPNLLGSATWESGGVMGENRGRLTSVIDPGNVLQHTSLSLVAFASSQSNNSKQDIQLDLELTL